MTIFSSRTQSTRSAVNRAGATVMDRLSRYPVVRTLLPLMLLVAVIGSLALFLAQAQQHSHDQLNERFNLRAQIASRFVTTYIDDLNARQRAIAERRMSGREVSERAFSGTVADDGYPAAVLLDDYGLLLRIAPEKPELLGTDMTGKYAHLRSAAQGRTAVSSVVPSAAKGIPIVAFAVPFVTPYGRRVYSAAYDISKSPLGAYLDNVTPISGNRVFLLDKTGKVVAKNGSPLPGVTTLKAIDPALARGLAASGAGSYETDSVEHRFASEPIKGTPWRIVIAVPSAPLYNSVEGDSRWIPWIAIAVLALGGLLLVALWRRVLVAHTRLAHANSQLNRLSRVDSLTGLYNRRHADELLNQLVSAGTRHDAPFAVLLADIDYFKRVNDVHGHAAGDAVLVATARAIQNALRTEDTAVRWGGEEFLAILPGETMEGAVVVAERIRKSVAAGLVVTAAGEPVSVTLTLGVAVWSGGNADDVIKLADDALYRGKHLGRNQVVTARVGAAQ